MSVDGDQLPRRKPAGYEKEKYYLFPPLSNPLPSRERELAESPPQAGGYEKIRIKITFNHRIDMLEFIKKWPEC